MRSDSIRQELGEHSGSAYPRGPRLGRFHPARRAQAPEHSSMRAVALENRNPYG